MMVSKMQITSLLLIHSYSNVGYKEHPAQRPFKLSPFAYSRLASTLSYFLLVSPEPLPFPLCCHSFSRWAFAFFLSLFAFSLYSYPPVRCVARVNGRKKRMGERNKLNSRTGPEVFSSQPVLS